ncbi:MAG: hypothetical protein ACREMC_01825 [Gemmatimonadales bacterium]
MEPKLPACTAAGFPVSLDAVGQYVAIDPAAAAGCVVFAANGSSTDPAEYLLVPQLATGAPGTTVRFDLVGDTILPAPLLSSPAPPPSSPEIAELPPAERFHTFLRLRDQSRWRGLSPQVVPPSPNEALTPNRAPAARAGPPAVGSTRQFMVCARVDCSRFDRVTARVRALKATVAIYVDTAAPAPPIGLDSAALDSLATLFDSRLHALDTAAFGPESDIDTNSVVLVLMTPVVNRLVSAEECRSGFIAGFFLGADLDPAYQKDPRSNKGEVFYSFVADTARCAPSAAAVQRFVPVTFIHEFQHMISYNQHVLVGGGDGEVLWLNEGLSHYAEELGGWSYPQGSPEFDRFMRGNLINAYAYLDATGDHFLAPSAGIGSLAERGAAWLFVRYVVDRYAGGTTVAAWNQLTRQLVVTNATGAENIEAVAGDPFTDIVTRWALANWVSDLPGFTAPPELTYDAWKFRTTYAALYPSTFPKPYPLTPTASAGPAVSLGGTLRAGSGVYHRVLQGPNEEGFTLRFSRRLPFNTNDWPIPASIKPRLSVIRIR